jgi:hypothetical protein
LAGIRSPRFGDGAAQRWSDKARVKLSAPTVEITKGSVVRSSNGPVQRIAHDARKDHAADLETPSITGAFVRSFCDL